MCSFSKRSASSLTVMARRSASRLAAGSSPFLVAAMIVIARVRACSQVSTVLGPRLMRRDRRPARYCTMYRLRPLGSTRSPKPGRSSSQMKYSRRSDLGGIDDALGQFRHGLRSRAMLDLLPGSTALARGSTMEARGRKSRREPAKTNVGAVGALKSTKSLKMRRKRKFCAILRSLLPATHNLKVVGSNPTPATKLRRQVKDLAALPFLRLCFDPASGSTVEARGRVIVGKSTSWRVGRVKNPPRQVEKKGNYIPPSE